METFNLTAAIRKYRTPSIQELKWKGNQTRLNGGKKKRASIFIYLEEMRDEIEKSMENRFIIWKKF